MAQDVGKVLWCHSHLVWLVFKGSRVSLFSFRKLFVTCSCCFVVVVVVVVVVVFCIVV